MRREVQHHDVAVPLRKPARHDPRIYPYLGRSNYAEHLGRWFDHFDRDRLLILTLEELEADRQGVTDRVFGFLGLEPLDAGRLGNVRDPWIRQFEPDPSRACDPGLLNVASYPAMNPETRRMPADHFRPHNDRLSALLKRDFNWDGPVPDHSTIGRFMQKVPAAWLEAMLAETARRCLAGFDASSLKLAADSTGVVTDRNDRRKKRKDVVAKAGKRAGTT